MANYGAFLKNVGSAIGSGLQAAAATSGRAAAQANAVSRQAQSAQGAFNQNSANIANSIGDSRISSQYGFNSAMMQDANAYNTGMWERTATWNEEMWERQAEFNREQAQIQRDWQERMDNTRYQRAIKDMSAAGLNPILAVTSGIDTSTPSGAQASVGGASMSSAQSAMASGGLLGANQASEGNYSGQMEYMGGILGCLAATMNGISSAMQNMGQMGSFGDELGEALSHLLDPKKWADAPQWSVAGALNKWIHRNDWRYSDDDKEYWHANRTYKFLR